MKARHEPDPIPGVLFIPCRDRLTPLLALISWLERVGQDEIYLLDNDSAFPPLLAYYRETTYPVLFLNKNHGPHAPWDSGLVKTLARNRKSIVSDPDVVPSEECPDDAIELLSDVLDRFPDRMKAGLGIRIDDLPDHYPGKPRVLEWERQFWRTQIAPGLYDADIDTTFALYQPGASWSYGPSIRTGSPYLLRHTPWYVDPSNLSAEEAFYQRRVDPAFSTWNIAGLPWPVVSTARDLDDGGIPDALRERAGDPPLVSCICPTYGRPPRYQHLLEEAVESFLRQTYPNKELIVLNDCPGQELICDAPGVRVINIPERFPTLGEKYNAAIALARGDLIAPWEDDDISLPWRLSLSVERLGDAGYFNPVRYWFLDHAGLHFDHPMGYGHNHSLFTRQAFETVGGYPAVSGHQDAEMDSALQSSVAWVGPKTPGQEVLPRHEWYYIYRWGVSPVHLSGDGSPESFYRKFGEQRFKKGRFVLHPHWRVDYEKATRSLVSGIVLYVVGDRADDPERNPAWRDFPPLKREKRESKTAHVARVAQAVDEALAAGGTHLLVPRQAAGCLGDAPLLVEYFATYHELVEASAETGLVFALRPHEPVSLAATENAAPS
jgi:hypothetical protein